MAGNISPGRVVLLPWYHESDFLQFQASRPAARDAPSYEHWRQAASTELFRQLASGHAVEIISVKPDGYRAWIAQRGLADDCGNRLRYVAALAAGG